jgi:phenylacetate-CoA ligase
VTRTIEAAAAERSERATLAALQGRRLTALLATIQRRNVFYTRKLQNAGITIERLHLPGDLHELPLTTKAELVADQRENPPWGTVLTESLDRYTRYNQTSATTGDPLRWLDTNESWQWMLECWKAVYRAARVDATDRILFTFSFGPFLGFWTAFEAGCQLGAHCIPAGGMSSQARLSLIDSLAPTVLCCTPTYALRLAEVAAETRNGLPDLSQSSLRVLILAGEPGGNIPATRERIQQAWGARVIDHHGLTEVGPVSFECWEGPGSLHLNECEFICEVLEPGSERPAPDGEAGELVITNLGRVASPVIRYRTGDIVMRLTEPCACGRTLARLAGGILARCDDMINVRGVNIYPAAIEDVMRRFDEVVEYRATVTAPSPLRSLSIEVELGPRAKEGGVVTDAVRSALRRALGLTAAVQLVRTGTLPRSEMKAHRFVVEK